MTNTLDLNGTWKLRWSDGQRGRPEYANRDETDPVRYIDATVPGEVHLDVWRAGWIPDPYVGTNCLAARWVEECIWSYRREFEVPANDAKWVGIRIGDSRLKAGTFNGALEVFSNDGGRSPDCRCPAQRVVRFQISTLRCRKRGVRHECRLVPGAGAAHGGSERA